MQKRLKQVFAFTFLITLFFGIWGIASADMGNNNTDTNGGNSAGCRPKPSCYDD